MIDSFLQEKITSIKAKYHLGIDVLALPDFGEPPAGFSISRDTYFFSFFKSKRLGVTDMNFKSFKEFELANSPKGIYASNSACFVPFPMERKIGIYSYRKNDDWRVDQVESIDTGELQPFYLAGKGERVFMISEVGLLEKYPSPPAYIKDGKVEKITIPADEQPIIKSIFQDNEYVYILDGRVNAVYVYDAVKAQYSRTVQFHTDRAIGSLFVERNSFYVIDTDHRLMKFNRQGEIDYVYDIIMKRNDILIKGGIWVPVVEYHNKFYVLDSRNNCLLRFEVSNQQHFR